MAAQCTLVGREAILRHVSDLLARRQSVLLYGPEGIGKTAVAMTVAHDGVILIDPFQGITAQRAAEMRRELDRGAVFLAASREAHGHQLGRVGRISWRFSRVRVRELPDAIVRRLIAERLEAYAGEIEPAWFRDVAALARGRPGFAIAMARFAEQWRAHRGYLPLPGFAFAAVREDAALRALRITGHDGSVRAPQDDE